MRTACQPGSSHATCTTGCSPGQVPPGAERARDRRSVRELLWIRWTTGEDPLCRSSNSAHLCCWAGQLQRLRLGRPTCAPPARQQRADQGGPAAGAQGLQDTAVEKREQRLTDAMPKARAAEMRASSVSTLSTISAKARSTCQYSSAQKLVQGGQDAGPPRCVCFVKGKASRKAETDATQEAPLRSVAALPPPTALGATSC